MGRNNRNPTLPFEGAAGFAHAVLGFDDEVVEDRLARSHNGEDLLTRTDSSARRARRTRLLPLALLTALAAVLAIPSAATAAPLPSPPNGSVVTVMSRNLYLGADLGPAIGADNVCEAIDAGGQILNDVDASDFPARAKLLAAEIASAKPDLVGLQEVALWRFQPNSDFTGSPATTVRYDFLQLLLDEMAARGANYSVAVVQDEFDQELPADRDGSDATNEFICGADEDGRLTMRDAILVRNDRDIQVSNPQSGQFDELYEVVLGGAIPIDVERGWTSLERPAEEVDVPLRQHPSRGVRRS